MSHFPTNRILPALVAAFVLVVAGCASAPVQEMSNARQALQAARDAGGADDPLYRRAEKLVNKAEQAIDRRRYTGAREKANRAGELAIRLIRQLHAKPDPESGEDAPPETPGNGAADDA